MPNDLMSPHEVRQEFDIAYQTVRNWVRRGKLVVVSRTLGGHARFNRADVEALKKTRTEKKTGPVVQSEHEIRQPPFSGWTLHSWRRRGLVVSHAWLRAIGALQTATAHLDTVRNTEIKRMTGLSHSELVLEVWRQPATKLAGPFNMHPAKLKAICELYEIKTPPRFYWSIKPGIRLARMRYLGFEIPAQLMEPGARPLAVTVVAERQNA